MNSSEVEILLVEDNPNDAELTLRSLRKNNLANRVIQAGDGVEALDFIFARGDHSERDIDKKPKVVILDLKLPKVDGLEVLEKVKSDPRTKTIPVVVLTSSQEDQDLHRCYELGVNSYIVKPVDFEKFTAAIKDVGLYWLVLNQPPL